MSELNPRCATCGDRAEFVVEPVGEYDSAGWSQEYACVAHLGIVAAAYAAAVLAPVQVTAFAVEAAALALRFARTGGQDT